MKIPDLFYPEYKQSLRLIMRRQSETNTVTFSPRHERGRVIWLKINKKKKSAKGFNKFISTESQEEGKLNAAA